MSRTPEGQSEYHIGFSDPFAHVLSLQIRIIKHGLSVSKRLVSKTVLICRGKTRFLSFAK